MPGGPHRAAVGRSLETPAEAEVLMNGRHLGINDDPSQSTAEDDLTLTFRWQMTDLRAFIRLVHHCRNVKVNEGGRKGKPNSKETQHAMSLPLRAASLFLVEVSNSINFLLTGLMLQKNSSQENFRPLSRDLALRSHNKPHPPFPPPHGVAVEPRPPDLPGAIGFKFKSETFNYKRWKRKMGRFSYMM